MDIAVFRPATGVWYVRQSTTNFTTSVSFQLGIAGDVPAPADYDGDGKADIVVYRPASSVWVYMLMSGTAYAAGPAVVWGSAVTSQCRPTTTATARRTSRSIGPAPAVGERRVELRAIPSTAARAGCQGDVPVPGDYDGDGIDRSSPCIGRQPASWYILRSSTGVTVRAFQWGLAGDIPVPGDYDGDAQTDRRRLPPCHRDMVPRTIDGRLPRRPRRSSGAWAATHPALAAHRRHTGVAIACGQRRGALAGDAARPRRSATATARLMCTVFRPSTGDMAQRCSRAATVATAVRRRAAGVRRGRPVAERLRRATDGRIAGRLHGQPAKPGSAVFRSTSLGSSVHARSGVVIRAISPCTGDFDGDGNNGPRRLPAVHR